MQKSENETNAPVRLTASQIAQATGVLARAFHSDPMCTHIFPDSDERAQSLPLLWDAMIRYSLAYGEVYTTPAENAVASWLAPGNWKITFWRMLCTGVRLPRAIMRLKGEARRRTLDIMTYIDCVHERELRRANFRRASWYLWMLGIDPAVQGQGIGGGLIHPILARSDEDGNACYLETAAEGNLVFYRKHGFEVVSEGTVPNQGLRIWAMLRVPH